eukprot:gnl/Chilomastix_cuspidata/2199.p1 GENE.gnl/Chilomastix_cuspidata/2199~~gnl/Chilomastix_cuspidata/2199.p1  ORF type:complete len:321 (-),score=154.28 gnl/Chilomastix_cuspidata/2199:36-998(-)
MEVQSNHTIGCAGAMDIESARRDAAQLRLRAQALESADEARALITDIRKIQEFLEHSLDVTSKEFVYVECLRRCNNACRQYSTSFRKLAGEMENQGREVFTHLEAIQKKHKMFPVARVGKELVPLFEAGLERFSSQFAAALRELQRALAHAIEGVAGDYPAHRAALTLAHFAREVDCFGHAVGLPKPSEYQRMALADARQKNATSLINAAVAAISVFYEKAVRKAARVWEPVYEHGATDIGNAAQEIAQKIRAVHVKNKTLLDDLEKVASSLKRALAPSGAHRSPECVEVFERNSALLQKSLLATAILSKFIGVAASGGQ